jgi:hypothetical protein
MHMRSRKALPGHFWGQFVPNTLPSSELGGIANMASLIDVCCLPPLHPPLPSQQIFDHSIWKGQWISSQHADAIYFV